LANEGNITVALDTRLNDELIEEGWAREIVSKLQNLRKELDFEVSDRIHIIYEAPAEIEAALTGQADYISTETLALSIKKAKVEDMHEVEMNDTKAYFSLKKA